MKRNVMMLVGCTSMMSSLYAGSSIATEVTYFYTDPSGNVLATTDASGRIIESRDYRPYGSPAMGGDVAGPGYSGHVKDEDTQLIYMQARYYDPEVGRFLSADPSRSEQQTLFNFNAYSYGNNGPVSHVDPDGRDAIAIAFPDYRIDTGFGFKMGGLGHAGVVIVDNRTGNARYFEYGRYDADKLGMARHFDVGKVSFQKSGQPTSSSITSILRNVSRLGGHGTRIEAAYFKNEDSKSMMSYAGDREAENSDKGRDPYSITGNNCMTFCKSTLEAGGIDSPSMIDPRPNSYIDELREIGQPVEYDPRAPVVTCGGSRCPW